MIRKCNWCGTEYEVDDDLQEEGVLDIEEKYCSSLCMKWDISGE